MSSGQQIKIQKPGTAQQDTIKLDSSATMTGLERKEPVVPRHTWYLPIKAVVEYLMAVVLLFLTAPFTILGIVLIKISSPGPAFYLQSRLGKDGRVFRIVKLRTMIHNAEAKTGAVWSTDGDPRITKIGRILRKTHIDEFPQLFNVLMGQMALIGPRPERPEIAHRLSWDIERYEERTRVKPGISGLAQLKLPPDTDLESVRKKLACDLYYIRCVNPWLDAQLVFFTGWQFAETFLVALWRRIYIPDARMINENVSDVFGEEIDLASPR